jgi:hypothetical protein
MNTSSVPIKTVKPRHDQLAMLAALGYTNNQICEKLGYTPARVSVLLADPSIKALVLAYQEASRQSLVQEQAERLTRELKPTIDRLLSHRDQTDDPGASLRACDMILARTMPVKTQHTEERTTKIIIERHEVQRLAAADEEMKIVNALATHPLDAAAD